MRAALSLALLALTGCPLATKPLASEAPATSPDGDADADGDGDSDGDADADADGDGDADADADADADGGPGLDAGPPVLPASCAAAHAADPAAPSGSFMIQPPGRDAVEVHCDMERFGGGWARAALVDSATRECPGDWVLVDPPGVCTRPDSAGSSESDATFESPQGPFNEVMGWILGVQFSSMDSFRPYGAGDDVMSHYVDGISISTVEGEPRHVWTYAVAWSDDDNRENSLCPCLGGVGSPPFVGEDYYCESGTTGTGWTSAWFTGDPLWDGDGAGSNCDTPANPSVFQKDLGASVEVPLRVRIEADQATTNENVGVLQMELYVR